MPFRTPTLRAAPRRRDLIAAGTVRGRPGAGRVAVVPDLATAERGG